MKVTASQFKMLANGRRKVLGDGKVIHARKSFALEGAPGMGKTSVVRSLATDWKLPLITVSINQWVNAADVVGFAYKGRKTENGDLEISGQDEIPPWLPYYRIDPATGDKVETNDNTKGFPIWYNKKGMPEAHAAVVLLDEFSAAKSAVQQTFLCVALDRVVKNFKLHNDTNFFIAYNGCDREGFEGQTSEISAALVGPNGRFDSLELIYEDSCVKTAVMSNPIISDFWKSFTDKYLADLNICDENDDGRNSCGRTYESLMEELSLRGYDSKNFDKDAKMCVNINFEGSEKVAKQFITFVNNFDIPTGEDYLSGKVVVKTQSEAVIGINAMATLFGFRNRSKKTVISNVEISALKDFLNKDYPTGTMNADGTPIMGSKTELYGVMKSAIIRENLQENPAFRFVADVLNSLETKSQKKSDEEECEF